MKGGYSSFMTTFAHRVDRLPRLGVGLSGEFDIAARGIDVCRMKERYPDLIHFYEYGADVELARKSDPQSGQARYPRCKRCHIVESSGMTL